jgi:hypothetical protein
VAVKARKYGLELDVPYLYVDEMDTREQENRQSHKIATGKQETAQRLNRVASW